MTQTKSLFEWKSAILFAGCMLAPFLYYRSLGPPVMPPETLLAESFAELADGDDPMMDAAGAAVTSGPATQETTLCRISKTGRPRIFRNNRPTGYVCLARGNAEGDPVFVLYTLRLLIFPPPQREEWRVERVRPERWSTTMSEYNLHPGDLPQL